MPFGKTAAAAAGGGMLGDEHRVAPERGLFAIVGDDGGRQTLGDEIFGVIQDHRQALVVQVLEIFWVELEAAAKTGSCQCGKKIVQVTHVMGRPGAAYQRVFGPPRSLEARPSAAFGSPSQKLKNSRTTPMNSSSVSFL